MKRSIAVLILALALALTACGGQKAADAQAEAKDITLCPTYDNGKGGYFSITLPASWGDHYVTECGANDGGYYVGFYEKTDHDNGLGGFLFMLEVFPTDYDYTELPEYQAAKVVFAFVGTEREIDTTALLRDVLNSGRTL